jgi:hypothetical protein
VKTYWDTSAVINAAISREVMERLDKGEHVTRLHTLFEFFAQMTGRGVKYRDKATGEETLLCFRPNECAAWLRDFAGRVEFEDLSKAEVLEALDEAQSRNVQGGHVYDYGHALASAKAKADQLLTRNTDDFKGLTGNVVWP